MLEEVGVEFEVVRYLEAPPTAAALDGICDLLGVEPTAIVRTGEKLFRDLGLALTDERSRRDWLNLLAAHPRLIERPIVIAEDRAVIGRPPETVLELLETK